MKDTLRYWSPVALCMIFIFVMSSDDFSSSHTSRIIEPLLRWLFPSLSQEWISILHGLIRKMAHSTEYFVLCFTLFRALRGRGDRRSLGRCAALSFTTAVLFAITDEFHQSFVASRTASPIDVGFDAFGALLAIGIGMLWYGRRGRACPPAVK